MRNKIYVIYKNSVLAIMLNGEEPGVRNEAVKYNTTRQFNNKPSDVIIDIESITTEQTKTNSRRSRLNAAEQATRRCLRRSMSISIAVLQRRHVRLRFQQETTSSDMDRMETIPLIPDEYHKTARIQRASTCSCSDIVTDLEIAAILANVDITSNNVSERTEKAISKYKKRAVASPALRDLMAASTSRSQINIIGGNGIHIGPEFVIVNQKVVNKEVIEGRILGLQVQSRKPRKWKEVRCGVIVFVCWSIIVSCALLYHVSRHGLFGNRLQERLDLGITKWWYINRTDWQAKDPRNTTFLRTPVSNVVIGHSEADFCIERNVCIKHVQEMQKREQEGRLWVDIGPNFLISGNGLIFEGRGVNVQGAMIKNYNHLSITIMFLGNYERDKTCPEQFHHLAFLLDVLVDQEVLSRDYRLLGYCQMAPPSVSPGPNIMDKLPEMNHWHSGQADDKHCVRR